MARSYKGGEVICGRIQSVLKNDNRAEMPAGKSRLNIVLENCGNIYQ